MKHRYLDVFKIGFCHKTATLITCWSIYTISEEDSSWKLPPSWDTLAGSFKILKPNPLELDPTHTHFLAGFFFFSWISRYPRCQWILSENINERRSMWIVFASSWLLERHKEPCLGQHTTNLMSKQVQTQGGSTLIVKVICSVVLSR